MNRRRSSNLHFIKSFFQLFLSPYNPSLDGAHPFKLLSLLSESSSSMLILLRSFADLRRLIVEMLCNEKEEESGTNFVYSFDFCNKCFVNCYIIYTKYVLLLPRAPIGPKKCGCRMRPSETLRRQGEEFILCLRLFNHRWFFKEIQNFSRVHPFL